MKRILTATLASLALSPAAVAIAAPAQDFGVRLTNVKSSGSYTMLIKSRTYDTSGVVAPPMVDQTVRFPAGAKLDRRFLTRRFLCNLNKLKASRKPNVCKSARLGSGRLLIDLRPFFAQAVPSNIHVFLGRATRPGAVAALLILALPDENSPIVQGNQAIRDIKPVLEGNLFDDPSSKGKFGYRMDLPMNPDAPVWLSVSEVRLAISGLTQRKRVRRCAKRGRGKCVRRKTRRKRIFWFKQPTCPRSRRITFQATYSFIKSPSITRTARIGCPRFKRR